MFAHQSKGLIVSQNMKSLEEVTVRMAFEVAMEGEVCSWLDITRGRLFVLVEFRRR